MNIDNILLSFDNMLPKPVERHLTKIDESTHLIYTLVSVEEMKAIKNNFTFLQSKLRGILNNNNIILCIAGNYLQIRIQLDWRTDLSVTVKNNKTLDVRVITLRHVFRCEDYKSYHINDFLKIY